MRRGWTLLLGAYLLLWVPITFANEIFAAGPSLGMRGAPALVELAVHGVVTVLCAAAGWMLLAAAPAALPVASGAVAAAALVSIQSLVWTRLPRQTAPGERVPLVLLILAHAIFWLVMLARARRRQA